MKYYIIILTCLILASCKTKQTITSVEKKDSIVYVTKMQIDTIYKEKIKEIHTPYEVRVEIPAECDSTGLIKPFNYVGKGKNTETKVTSSNGKLYVSFEQSEYYNEIIKDYRILQSKYDSVTKIKNIVKKQDTKIIKRTWWQGLLTNLCFILFCIATILLILSYVGIRPQFIK